MNSTPNLEDINSKIVATIGTEGSFTGMKLSELEFKFE